MRVEDAFVVAVSRSRAKEAHGRWIPADYWVEKLVHVLSELDVFIKRMTPKQLLSKLEKRGFLDRELNLPMDECFSPVTRIHSNHKKLSVGDEGKEKTIYFLFLETKLEPPSWSTASEWQGYYDKFMRRQTHQLRVERRQSEEEPTTSTMAPPRGEGEEEQLTAAPRPVTPTVVELDNDLKAILEPFFVELGSFKGDNIGLRKAIQAFGCRQQWTTMRLLLRQRETMRISLL